MKCLYWIKKKRTIYAETVLFNSKKKLHQNFRPSTIPGVEVYDNTFDDSDVMVEVPFFPT